MQLSAIARPTLLVAACFLAAPVFAGGTIKVTRSAQLAAGADKVWNTVKDFDSIESWHPAFGKTEMKKGGNSKPGAVRVLTLKDGGAKITETLTGYNAPGRTYSYRIDQSPLPITGYNSTITVKPAGKGSTVTWSSTFAAKAGTKDEEARKIIEGAYDAGLDNLKKMLGA